MDCPAMEEVESITVTDLLSVTLSQRRMSDRQELVELSRIKRVQQVLSSPRDYTKLAAAMSEKHCRLKKRGRESVNASQRVVGWEGLRDNFKTPRIANRRVNMAIIDQKEELMELRSKGLVQKQLAESQAYKRASMLFGLREPDEEHSKVAIKVQKCARNVYVTDDAYDFEENTRQVVRKQTNAFVSTVFSVPSRSKRVLERLTSQQILNIAKAEKRRTSQVGIDGSQIGANESMARRQSDPASLKDFNKMLEKSENRHSWYGFNRSHRRQKKKAKKRSRMRAMKEEVGEEHLLEFEEHPLEEKDQDGNVERESKVRDRPSDESATLMNDHMTTEDDCHVTVNGTDEEKAATDHVTSKVSQHNGDTEKQTQLQASPRQLLCSNMVKFDGGNHGNQVRFDGGNQVQNDGSNHGNQVDHNDEDEIELEYLNQQDWQDSISMTTSIASSSSITRKLNEGIPHLQLSSEPRPVSAPSLEPIPLSSGMSLEEPNDRQYALPNTEPRAEDSFQEDWSWFESLITPLITTSSPTLESFSPSTSCSTCHPLSTHGHSTTDKHQVPEEAWRDIGFLKYCEHLDHEPTRDDYTAYKILVISEQIEEKYGAKLNNITQELLYYYLSNELTYRTYSKSLKKLVLQAQYAQEQAFLVTCTGRRLLEKVPKLQDLVAKYTVTAVEEMAAEFVYGLDFSFDPDDPEKGWDYDDWNDFIDTPHNKRDVQHILEENSVQSEVVRVPHSDATPIATPMERNLQLFPPTYALKKSTSVEVLVNEDIEVQEEVDWHPICRNRSNSLPNCHTPSLNDSSSTKKEESSPVQDIGSVITVETTFEALLELEKKAPHPVVFRTRTDSTISTLSSTSGRSIQVVGRDSISSVSSSYTPVPVLRNGTGEVFQIDEESDDDTLPLLPSNQTPNDTTDHPLTPNGERPSNHSEGSPRPSMSNSDPQHGRRSSYETIADTVLPTLVLAVPVAALVASLTLK